MGQDSYALLKVVDTKADQRAQKNGRIERLEDATAVWMPVRFEDFNPEFAAADWSVLEAHLGGSLLKRHTDRRGVFVFSDIVEPQGKTYDQVLENSKAIGYWVPKQLSKKRRSAAMLAKDDEAAWQNARGLFEAGELPSSSPYYEYFHKRYLALGLAIPKFKGSR